MLQIATTSSGSGSAIAFTSLKNNPWSRLRLQWCSWNQPDLEYLLQCLHLIHSVPDVSLPNSSMLAMVSMMTNSIRLTPWFNHVVCQRSLMVPGWIFRHSEFTIIFDFFAITWSETSSVWVSWSWTAASPAMAPGTSSSWTAASPAVAPGSSSPWTSASAAGAPGTLAAAWRAALLLSWRRW